MLELYKGRDGAGGKIYSAGAASDSEDERPRLIERLMEVAGEREIERLFLAAFESARDDLKDDFESRLCPFCGEYWLVKELGGRPDQFCDGCRPPPGRTE